MRWMNGLVVVLLLSLCSTSYARRWRERKSFDEVMQYGQTHGFTDPQAGPSSTATWRNDSGAYFGIKTENESQVVGAVLLYPPGSDLDKSGPIINGLAALMIPWTSPQAMKKWFLYAVKAARHHCIDMDDGSKKCVVIKEYFGAKLWFGYLIDQNDAVSVKVMVVYTEGESR